jgi:hypothetical protein
VEIASTPAHAHAALWACHTQMQSESYRSNILSQILHSQLHLLRLANYQAVFSLDLIVSKRHTLRNFLGRMWDAGSRERFSCLAILRRGGQSHLESNGREITNLYV